MFGALDMRCGKEWLGGLGNSFDCGSYVDTRTCTGTGGCHIFEMEQRRLFGHEFP
jgi:hypothetical protein